MPSPFGHALAGAAIGFVCQPVSRPATSSLRAWAFPLVGAATAALPDADLLIPHFHRTATHSLTATLVIGIVAAVVTGKVTGRIWWRLVVLLGAAHASHLALDWVGVDRVAPRGFQMLWPFSPHFYVSDWDWFPPTDRRLFQGTGAFMTNLHAFLVELVKVGPMAAAAWWATRTRRSRVLTSGQDGRPRPSA